MATRMIPFLASTLIVCGVVLLVIVSRIIRGDND